MVKTKIYFTKQLCKFLPPILAHQLQALAISPSEAALRPFNFRSKSFTGGYLEGSTKDVLAFKFLIHGYFDWRNVILSRAILKKNEGDVIEVGANIGTETVSLAKINSGNIHAFEPLPENFKSLKFMKETNSYSNLFLYRSLVSDMEGNAWFKVPEANNSGTGFIVNGKSFGDYEIEVTTLDKKLNNLNSCAIMILDVEGFELKVLKGSRKIIEKFRPFIILEVNSDYLKKRGEGNISMLHNFLNAYDYDCFSIERFKLKKVRVEKLNLKTNSNWICLPREHKKLKSSFSRSLTFNAFNPFFHLFLY